jgi:hypothetical protein
VTVVVEDLDKIEEDIGLSKELLESQAMVALKSDLSKVKFNKAANSVVYVNVLAVAAGHSRL